MITVDVGQRWSEYLSELIQDERSKNDCAQYEHDEGLEVLQCEIESVMNEMKRG